MSEVATLSDVASGQLHDVVVIGAGPAGAVAALEAARLGCQVLLLERHRFPRYKLCGACLNGGAVGSLKRLQLQTELERLMPIPLTSFQLTSGRRRLRVPIHGGVAVSRERFDQMLVDAAVAAGARFVAGVSATVCAMTAEPYRMVMCRDDQGAVELRARCVILAAGLGGDARSDDPALESIPNSATRLGAGTRARIFPEEYGTGTIFMAAAAAGYVGLTRIEDGTLNIAAALDPVAVKSSDPASTCRQILAACGMPVTDEMFAGRWKGTIGLTRHSRATASERLFVVGDAAGYVEPFTGEGMAWAVNGGAAVAPLAARAVQHWDPDLAAEWTRTLNDLVTQRQRWCRRLATALRYPLLVRTLMSVVSTMPSIGRALARRIHEEN